MRRLAAAVLLCLTAVVPGHAAVPVKRHFFVPAADAAVSLAQIAEQGNAQILFLTDAVQGVATRPVLGEFSVPEALGRLLEGTDLMITEDRETGAFSVSRKPVEGAADTRTVQMRSYIVATIRVEKHPWRYASADGIEILTRAPDFETEWILHSIERGLWVQHLFLPPTAPIPATIIVDDLDQHTETEKKLHSQPLNFQSAPDSWAWGGIVPSLGYGQIAALDSDTYAKNINIYRADTRGMLTDSGWALRQRLHSYAPPLPEWFIVGLAGKFGVTRESFAFVPGQEAGASWTSVLTLGAGSNAVRQLDPPVRRIVGPGTIWLSEADTALLREHLQQTLDAHIPLLPLSRLFSGELPSEEERPLWDSEAGLFVRWAIFAPEDKDAAMKGAFAQLLRRARSGPVTNRVFSECYGFGFAVMESKLESFLKTVLGQPIELPPDFGGRPLQLTSPNFQKATDDQVGRILGDWLRMKGEELREGNPSLSEDFLDAAGRVLARTILAAEDGSVPPGLAGSGRVSRKIMDAAVDRVVAGGTAKFDPGFVAVFGLYENDRRDREQAGRVLELAVAAGARRPQAYFVLGQLRHDAINPAAGDNARRFTVAQTTAILAPLLAGRGLEPRNAAIYRLIARTLAESAGPLTPADRAVLEEGRQLFPRDTELSSAVAMALARRAP